jgi:type VI protein secretion system component VasK
MLIKTKKFQFPKFLYFSILLKSALSRSGWIILLVFSMAVYQGVKGVNSTVLILGALPLIFFLYLVIRCWFHASSKKNELFYKERFFEIDDDYLVSFLEDGTINKIKINNIARVVKKSGSYRLFLTRKQFVYIPLNAFRTNGDINRFDSILKMRKREPIVNSIRKPS